MPEGGPSDSFIQAAGRWAPAAAQYIGRRRDAAIRKRIVFGLLITADGRISDGCVWIL